jgi:hypothetical protein
MFLKMLNEMKKIAPKIIQNVLQNEYIFWLKIYHCNVLSPINKTIINVYLIKEKKIVSFSLCLLFKVKVKVSLFWYCPLKSNPNTKTLKVLFLWLDGARIYIFWKDYLLYIFHFNFV